MVDRPLILLRKAIAPFHTQNVGVKRNAKPLIQDRQAIALKNYL
ncbi:hypothetical protein [Nostoc sp.]